MLGLVLIYFIGKTFMALAEAHQKHKWGHAILGVVSYYAGTLLAGIIFLLFMESDDPFSETRTTPDILINLLSIPFGALTCWLTYYFLQKRWEEQAIVDNSDILDMDDEGFL